MSTTYFNNSNIGKLTDKSRNKNKKIRDKKSTDEKGEENDKIVEGFNMPNIFSSSDNDDNKKDSTKKDSTTKDSTKKDSSIYPTSDIGKKDSNTGKTASSQLKPNSIIIFCIHALLSVFFAYVWGWLSTNYLYLATESKDNLDYILPIKEYDLPYTNNGTSEKCYFDYGFPYDIGSGRTIGKESAMTDKGNLETRQKDTTYYLWLSKEERQNPKQQVNFFGALTQYIFEAVYGGLGENGGRYLMRKIIGIFSITDIKLPTKEDTWDRMEKKTFLKVAAFLLWPIIMQFIFPLVGIWSGITSFIFGILQNHIIWGLVFSFTIGMVIAMGCGFYMMVNVFYIFFIYPWSNDNSDTAGKWRKIFDNLIPYMLLVFYYQICLYGFSDLGPSGGAGIMFIVIVSIVLQYWQHSS